MHDQAIKILEKQRQDLVVRVLRKHEEMEASRSFTERILAGISELFLLLDQEFQVIQTNREFLERTGFLLDSDQQLALEDLVQPETAEAIRQAFAKGEFTEFEAHLKTAKGTGLPVKMRGSTHVNPNGLVLHMLICSDCSEFYDLMAQMQEGQKQLIHSSRLASLGEMAAGVGHELTQPLNAILLFARNCLKALDAPGDHKDMLRENLQIIIDRVNKASSIIATMRSFGRKVEEEQAPLDLNQIIRKILKFLEAQLRLSEVFLDLRLDDHPCVVLGVEVRLEQVFLNLVQNAVQAMGRVVVPRLTITSRITDCLNLTTMQKEPYVLVTVADNGEGIPEELQKKIFDPFFTTREVGTGTGLGLSIVDRIVRGFSGHIEVESVPGKGACFSVYIPQYRPAPTTEGPRQEER
ncbi:PAS/PAC sensor signal transduction histidine kinase [Desulfobulbus propionicus DSM 2032]|jgi:C4-dicarboxylate-specific signal transduction histidine kinase|uniref:histidine kinase n=1 Tax=Desulfobulbus propionicus (strain ATCC 33891 / DSM 2032 / VKM B-1956 / 1pr3) TaxID=577650 RepID=A0A7U4DQG0_DESPD|nr:ATP-binding protein [Desulfobulbus propionicus]ADW18987.1 PAS/PAC sensor signal transduction histidine kinase [Desulfobulbus propionicus DSM 2032]